MATIKRTLLDIVSEVLSDIGGDPVNDLDDTVESSRVTGFVIQTFWNMVATREIPEHYELDRLTALADNTRPTHLILPDSFLHLEWFKYNKSEDGTTKEYREVYYKEPKDFIEMLNSRNSSSADIDTSTTVDNSVELLVYNNRHPQYWTSFDNKYIICDSYDSDVDNTLQQSKTQVWARKAPTLTRSAAATLDLEAAQMQTLYNEVLSVSRLRLEETPDAKAEQWVKRHRSNLQKTKYRDKEKRFKRNYGRS